MEDDEKWMRCALKEAECAFFLGEVPVGAVIVHKGEVIAKAHNLTESRQDPTAHAEVLCIQKASQRLQNWRLQGATLYCTLEPCIMCAGSMIQSRLSHLVWAAPDMRQGAHGSLINILDHPHPIHSLTVRSGICAEESGALLRSFFSLRRKGKIPSPRPLSFFEELITLQKKQLANLARELIPHLTDEDLLQPNDFPDLEHNPYFRYEEGVLAGLLTAQAAFLANQNN